jgi:hypothetical protein
LASLGRKFRWRRGVLEMPRRCVKGHRMKPSVALGAALAAFAIAAAPATAATRPPIKVAPKEIDFGTRAITDPATDYFDGVKVTNTTDRTLDVIVVAGLPDDFGFGLMPGSTCPVFESDPPMPPGSSCRAVVRFTPTPFFAGWLQIGTLTIDARDPATGAVVASVQVPVSGTGKL